MTVNIASALRNSRHITAIVEAVRDELDALPLEPLTPYLIDTVPESALFFLAEQFNVTGFRGWNMALTVADRRELLLNAVRLQRIKGTPAAIRESLASLGFSDIDIEEGVGGATYDGTYIYDGSILHDAGNWAHFRVRLNVPSYVAIDNRTVAAIRQVIEEYKNARSVLVDITWVIVIEDDLILTDETAVDNNGFVDFVSGNAYLYDGSQNHDGSQSYGEEIDTVVTYINGVIYGG